MIRLVTKIRQHWRLPDTLAMALIGVIAWLRVIFLQTNRLQLSADEMHYWDWSRQLDFAYYSKGPLMAFLIRASTIFLAAPNSAYASRPLC